MRPDVEAWTSSWRCGPSLLGGRDRLAVQKRRVAMVYQQFVVARRSTFVAVALADARSQQDKAAIDREMEE